MKKEINKYNTIIPSSKIQAISLLEKYFGIEAKWDDRKLLVITKVDNCFAADPTIVSSSADKDYFIIRPHNNQKAFFVKKWATFYVYHNYKVLLAFKPYQASEKIRASHIAASSENLFRIEENQNWLFYSFQTQKGERKKW